MFNQVERTSDPYADCRDAIGVMERCFASTTGWVMLSIMSANTFERNIQSHKTAITSFTEGELSKGGREITLRSLPQYDLPSFRKWFMARVYGAV